MPLQNYPRSLSKCTEAEQAVIRAEIVKLLHKAVIIHVQHEPGEFISPIFVRPKKDGTSRMILNLKDLKQHVEYHHFKMETLIDAIRLMTPNCFMASVDLKDAICSFEKTGTHFVIDDSYLQGDDYVSCLENVIDTVRLLFTLGFVIHPDKSVLIPTQRLIFLGFILDSVLMRVYMTPEKVTKVIEMCSKLLKNTSPTIREVSQVVGYIISTFPGVMLGPLFFRHLEGVKSQALKVNKGNFDSLMTLNDEAREELTWWVNSAPDSYNVVSHGLPAIVLTTDASSTGWGCTLGETRTGGNWTKDEAQHHINYLELLAVFLALKTFANSLAGKHVKVMIDNMTALSDINHMGTSKSDLRNALSKSMWLWCRARHIWLTAVHIPVVENVEADHQSRITNTSAEWSLNKQIFYDAISRLGVTPDIDLFASRINYQIEPYLSFHPDPGPIANFPESPGGTVHCCCGNPKIANSDMVAKTNESTNSSTNTITENKDDTDPPEQSGSNTSTVSASRANNLPLVWKSLEEQGISAGASNIIVQSWRQGTAKQYRSYLQKWELYCNKRKIDPIHPTISDGINFLSSL
ncbi:Transposon Tf2-6 poly, partial [Paramuricea clavata]